MIESKRDKFIRLAETSTNKALEMIRLIGNLSNKTVYDYTDKDVDKIFNALETEIQLAKKHYDIIGGDKFKLI